VISVMTALLAMYRPRSRRPGLRGRGRGDTGGWGWAMFRGKGVPHIWVC
jgi:hypothetical protein